MMYRVRTLAVVAIGIAVLSLPLATHGGIASAEPALSPGHHSGIWTIGEDFSDATCRVELSTDPAAVGYRIVFDDDCRSNFPILMSVAAWRPDGNGGILLIDRSGEVVVDYSVSETDSLLSVVPDNVMLHLTPDSVDPTVVGAVTTHDGPDDDTKPAFH